MKKINFRSFEHLNIENIGLFMDCIELPLAYIASQYKTEHFINYYIASHCNDIWGENFSTFIEKTNSIMFDLGLKMSPPLSRKQIFFYE